MKKNIIFILLGFVLSATAAFAAYNSFIANGDITVQNVQGDGLTADFKIFNGSTAESWTINSSGRFSVSILDGSSFMTGSADSDVKAIVYGTGEGADSCAENATPGTTYITLETAGGYTITPKSSACCATVAHALTYHEYPSCGAATCETGYYVNGGVCYTISGGGGGGGGSIAPTPTTTTYPNGTLLRANNSDKVYLIDAGQKRWIPTGEIFTGNGYSWSSIKVVEPSVVSQYTEGVNVQMATQADQTSIPEGAIIRANGDIDVYIVKYVGAKKFKRLVLSPSVFNSYGHLKWSDIKDIDKSVADSFVVSDLVRAVNDSKVYKLYPSGDTGEKRWVKTANVFTQMNLDWDSIYEINQTDRNSYNDASALE
ncbi:MAG: hypothetical protein HY764_02675 [Candidatus Portnoybacteria bacterium]|nr:hypothetical protein [Candidatus Portnoybacteria bacterium]